MSVTDDTDQFSSLLVIHNYMTCISNEFLFYCSDRVKSVLSNHIHSTLVVCFQFKSEKAQK